jgi:hypothetical protein
MFELTIETGNAAMETPEHVAAALREISRELDSGGTFGHIRDANGNRVGEWEYTLTDDQRRERDTARHLAELREIGYTADDLDPLRGWERFAHGAAEDYCNVPDFDWDAATERVEQHVAELFGGELPDGFFVNGDPRGYALKLRSGTGSLTYRDWGDFEILAPDFS